MRKLVTIAAAGIIAIVASVSTTTQSQAFFPLLGVVGLAAAAGATVAATDDRWYHDGYFGGYGWNDHVAACEDAYRTYDFHTDTYVRKVDGRLMRVYCEL